VRSGLGVRLERDLPWESRAPTKAKPTLERDRSRAYPASLLNIAIESLGIGAIGTRNYKPIAR